MKNENSFQITKVQHRGIAESIPRGLGEEISKL